MNKDHLLRTLAEHGYNVSFGARKHFATYDIVEKVPSFLGLSALIIGVWQIYMPNFKYNAEVSLLLIVVGIIALSMSQYNSQKEIYQKVGVRLIGLHNELKELYYQVKGSDKENYSNEVEKMNQVMSEYYDISLSKQITTSDWYAHYKFFVQTQHEWINEQKNFTLKDKIPMSFVAFIILIIVTIILITVTRGG